MLQNSAILSIFIKLPFVRKIFVLSIFEWPNYTGLLYLISIQNYELNIFNFTCAKFIK